MPHPRRSRQFRSARARAFRAKDVNLPRLHYVAEGRTLLLVQTRAILDLEREERVERAAAMVRHLEGQVQGKAGEVERLHAQDAAVRAQGLIPANRVRRDRQDARRLARWLTEDKAALADALWELTQARRSLARPAAIHVTLAVVSPPGPRC